MTMESGKRRFGYSWRVVANDGNEQREWPGQAVNFDWHRTADSQPNELKLEIINLNESSRAFIERKGVNIELYGGYRDTSGLLFKGAVEFGASAHDKPQWNTGVTVKDGAIQWRNIFISKSFAAGTSEKDVIEALVKELTGLPANIQQQFQAINQGLKGQQDIVPVVLFPQVPRETQKRDRDRTPPPLPEQIAKKEQQLATMRAKAEAVKKERARLARGPAFAKLDVLAASFGLQCIWDNQTLHLVPGGLHLVQEVVHITPLSGLIGSPRKIETGWEFDCQLDHRLQPGALVSVGSDVFDGLLLISRLEGHGRSHFSNEWRNLVQGRPYDGN